MCVISILRWLMSKVNGMMQSMLLQNCIAADNNFARSLDCHEWYTQFIIRHSQKSVKCECNFYWLELMLYTAYGRINALVPLRPRTAFDWNDSSVHSRMQMTADADRLGQWKLSLEWKLPQTRKHGNWNSNIVKSPHTHTRARAVTIQRKYCNAIYFSVWCKLTVTPPPKTHLLSSAALQFLCRPEEIVTHSC